MCTKMTHCYIKQGIGLSMKNKQKLGFTLIELIVALAVASILSGAIFSFYISTQKNYHKEQNRVAEAQSIRSLGQLIDTKIRQSSQYLSIEENLSNNCVIITDLRSNYDVDAEVYVPNVIGTYCTDGTIIKVDDVMYFDYIQDLGFISEKVEQIDEAGNVIDTYMTKVEVSIKGIAEEAYDKVFVLRHQE